MNDHLNDGLQKDGFSLSEVTSRVVPHSGGTATAATVRLERLDEDEHTGRVSFVVTTCKSLPSRTRQPCPHVELLHLSQLERAR